MWITSIELHSTEPRPSGFYLVLDEKLLWLAFLYLEVETFCMAVPKVHKEYDELVDLLLSRGMDARSRTCYQENLAIGYYRLSGFLVPSAESPI